MKMFINDMEKYDCYKFERRYYYVFKLLNFNVLILIFTLHLRES
jgi:hypothetical protein